MVICFNLPLVGSYARDILSGVLSAAKSFPELSLWLPHAQIQQVVPTHVDGVIGATHAKGLAGLPRTVPIINVNSGIRPGTWQVCTDNDAVGQLAFDHFMERNIRSFAVFRIKTKGPPWTRLAAFNPTQRRPNSPGPATVPVLTYQRGFQLYP